HVKLTRRDHSRTAFTDHLNRVPKRGAIITLHIDGERVKLRIDVVHEQPRGQRAASLGVFDVLATEVDQLMPKKRRVYISRVVGNQVMTSADLERLHKYMLDIEHIDHISDETRAVVKSEGPELAHKLPPAKPNS